MQQMSFFRYFMIFQCYFAHDISTFKISSKFISSSKFEFQVQPNPFFAAQALLAQVGGGAVDCAETMGNDVSTMTKEEVSARLFPLAPTSPVPVDSAKE